MRSSQGKIAFFGSKENGFSEILAVPICNPILVPQNHKNYHLISPQFLNKTGKPFSLQGAKKTEKLA